MKNVILILSILFSLNGSAMEKRPVKMISEGERISEILRIEDEIRKRRLEVELEENVPTRRCLNGRQITTIATSTIGLLVAILGIVQFIIRR